LCLVAQTHSHTLQSENGIYYVDLNPRLYAADVIYDLVWHVSYTSSAPNKKLVTRFKINPINIGRSIDVEMSERNTIEIEYPGSSIIEVEVLGNY
jgi:hypothetical protein